MIYRTKIRRRGFLCLIAAALAVFAALPQASGEKQEPARTGVAERKSESKLVLMAGRPGRGFVGFPMEFTAAPGETIGAIRAELVVPQGGSKLLKVELPPGSRLKVSVRQQKPDKGGKAKRGEAALELNFSAGQHAIRDGLIGTLQFSLPALEGPAPQAPRLLLLGTSPPQIVEATPSSEAPSELPPGPVANPSVGCFFFSH
jgi:hypothetical protein